MNMDNIDEVITGVSLTFTYQDYHIQQSGVLLYDYVLTTGGIVLPYVFSEKVKDIKNFNIKIHVQKYGKMHCLRGYIAYVLHSNDLNNALIKNEFGLDSTTIKSLSHFLIIGIENPLPENITRIKFTLEKNALYKGQDALTVSTPFGNLLFFNSFTKGIVSNIIDNELFITDSRLSICSEGGPIYVFNESIELMGLVLMPIMKAGEYTGFNLCCSFYLAHEAFCLEIKSKLYDPILTSIKEKPPIHCVSDTVLPIKTPSSRGSSILLHENGLLVTCSHVINYDSNTPVEVIFLGKPYEAKILCCSSKDDILDLAFLQIHTNNHLPTCTFSDVSPMKGTAVYVVGYEKMWDNFVQLVSKGTVLKHEEHGPIYTTCLTHSGNSGGGLFEENGKLLAIVCGILFETDKRTLHHCHNVGIPIKLMKKSIDSYALTGDVSHLMSLCQTKDLHLPNWNLFIVSKL